MAKKISARWTFSFVLLMASHDEHERTNERTDRRALKAGEIKRYKSQMKIFRDDPLLLLLPLFDGSERYGNICSEPQTTKNQFNKRNCWLESIKLSGQVCYPFLSTLFSIDLLFLLVKKQLINLLRSPDWPIFSEE